MNNLFRWLFIRFGSFNKSKLPVQRSPANKMANHALEAIRITARKIAQSFMLGIFIVFTIVWGIVFSLLFWGKAVFSALGEENSVTFIKIGFVILPVGLFIIIISNSDSIKAWIIKTKAYGVFANWIYKLFKIYFDKILLPNIELIEPGLNAQDTDSFPDTVSYSDEKAKTPEHIQQVLNNHLRAKLALFLTMLPIVFIFLMLFSNIPFISDIIEIVSTSLAVTVFLLACIGLLPEILSSRREQVLLDEYAKLSRDQWLQSRIDEIQEYTEGAVKQYGRQLSEIKAALANELKRLTDLQSKVITTQETVKQAYDLVRNNQSIVRLILEENQDLEAERENQKYWKDKAVDIAIGFIVGMITTVIGSYYF